MLRNFSKLWPYLQTLDWAERACQGQNSIKLRKFVNYGQKSFITFAPGTKVIKLLLPQLIPYRSKLECLSMAVTFPSLIRLGEAWSLPLEWTLLQLAYKYYIRLKVTDNKLFYSYYYFRYNNKLECL